MLAVQHREKIMRSEDAQARAAQYAARAEDVADEHTRMLFTTLRDSWTRIADNNWGRLDPPVGGSGEPAVLRPYL
jgi:hypothetical protein